MPATQLKVIRNYERRPSSVYGNPRFRFWFEDGTVHDGMHNAGWAYAVGNREMREGSTVEITLTRAGNIRTMRAAS